MTTPSRRTVATLAGSLLLLVPACGAAAASGERATSAAGPAASSAASSGLPSRTQWYADVRRAMRGSQVYLGNRVAQGGDHLAVNLDIDNTSLATEMDHMKPIPRMQRFVGAALDNDVTILFNTGRLQSHLTEVTQQLRDAGYHPTEVCGKRRASEGLSHSKQRCRARFVREGYTIIANVGNRATDFTGGDYERAFKLPNYGNRLH